MLTVSAAWEAIDRAVLPLAPVARPLAEALGARLAEDIFADEDMPAFSRSAVDGFAVNVGQGAGAFRLVGEVRPGGAAGVTLRDGEALRIFTGSAVADGWEVVMVEDTDPCPDGVQIKVPPSRQFVRLVGSQARRGEVLLAAGATITAGAAALMASVGVVRPRVSPRLRVAHIGTGSELVDAETAPPMGFIRDSNGPLIRALVAEAGAEVVQAGRVSEDADEAVAALRDTEAEVYLISGGASVGAYDGTRDALERLGFTIHFSKVSCRPGKPLIFATRGAAVAFGLPGNPLSHFVCFQLFVRRALRRLAGHHGASLVPVRPVGTLPGADPRETWWPARVHATESGLAASALPWRDSSDLTGLPRANALLRIPPDGLKPLAEALVFGMITE